MLIHYIVILIIVSIFLFVFSLLLGIATINSKSKTFHAVSNALGVYIHLSLLIYFVSSLAFIFINIINFINNIRLD